VLYQGPRAANHRVGNGAISELPFADDGGGPMEIVALKDPLRR
jgi:hypothetical protein